MEWINRLNSAINYIEEHILDEIDMERVGNIAGCSSYHFQRMFAYMANVPLTEYMRRRKMSLAAVDLLHGDKVLDVACRYGYDSPTAFNRAFKTIHGVAPSKITDEDVMVKSFPPIHFHISIKGDCEMNYRIVKKESFRIAGVSMPLEKEVEKNFELVPQMWGKAHMDGTIGKLTDMMNTDLKGILGVSACNGAEDWTYYISVATTMEADGQMQELEVPANTWAVFSGQGSPQSIQDLERRIVCDWLPTSGYEYANAPDMELYLNSDSEQMEYEVWIPVVKSSREV